MAILDLDTGGGRQKAATVLLLLPNGPRRQIALSLHHAGYNVIEAETAAEVLEIAAARPAAAVVVDTGIGGLDPFAMMDALRRSAATRTCSVVFAGADASICASFRRWQFSFAAALPGPLSSREIVRALRDAGV